MQGVGFTPGRVAKQYDANRSVRNYESRIIKRRQNLINRWYLEWRNRDRDGQWEAMQAIRGFNKNNPRNIIDFDTLKRSWKTRQRFSTESKHGITLKKKTQHIKNKVRFADD